MGWKDWSYVKKGGVIGLIIGVLIWLYDVDFLLNFGGPSTIITQRVYGGVLGIIIISIVICSLIGWLYGKIKNRKQGGNK